MNFANKRFGAKNRWQLCCGEARGCLWRLAFVEIASNYCFLRLNHWSKVKFLKHKRNPNIRPFEPVSTFPTFPLAFCRFAWIMDCSKNLFAGNKSLSVAVFFCVIETLKQSLGIIVLRCSVVSHFLLHLPLCTFCFFAHFYSRFCSENIKILKFIANMLEYIANILRILQILAEKNLQILKAFIETGSETIGSKQLSRPSLDAPINYSKLFRFFRDAEIHQCQCGNANFVTCLSLHSWKMCLSWFYFKFKINELKRIDKVESGNFWQWSSLFWSKRFCIVRINVCCRFPNGF